MSILTIFSVLFSSLILSLVLSLVFLLRHGFMPMDLKPYPMRNPSYQSWDEIIKKAPPIDIIPMKTGEITGNRLDFVNTAHPDALKVKNIQTPMPVWAFGICHQTYGDLLIDAGYSSLKNNDTINPVMAIVQFLKKGSNTQEPDQPLEKQIHRLNLHPEKVFFTHFHPDHTAGSIILDDDIEYIASKDEFNFMGKAASGSYLKDKNNILFLDFNKARSLPPFEKTIDLFGDGSLWAIFTPGHTKGHVSYLGITKDGPALLIGDACFFNDAWRYGIDSDCQFSKDRKKSRQSIMQLKKFQNLYPQTRIYVGHDDLKIDDLTT